MVVLFFCRTSKVTHGCPWRESCPERSEEAGGVTRVAVESTALFGLLYFDTFKVRDAPNVKIVVSCNCYSASALCVNTVNDIIQSCDE